MAALFFDSQVFGGAWARAELRALFDEAPRTRDWLEILAVLAETQAAFGLVPAAAAKAVARACREIELTPAFFDEVRAGYEKSNHSMLGLIGAVQRHCPDDSGEWLYYGATVQDITDTWLARTLKFARDLFSRDLAAIDAALCRLCERHRGTLMAGRTHGQQGLPITFGFKAAGWLAEVRRHRRRFTEIAGRMDVGQLAGGVGSLASLGPRALELQAQFLDKLGLRAPPISWTVSRDVWTEWCHLLALAAGTADRIGHEVYTLQRPEIGEVSEGFVAGTVGSITMPHKRNPERSEHLGTLARVVRHSAALLAEGQVHEHERDGRSWKAEWLAVPQATLAAGKAFDLLRDLLETLNVHPDRMRTNLDATQGFVVSEAAMLLLAGRIGKQSAHRLIYETSMRAAEQGQPLQAAIIGNRQIMAHLSPPEVEALFDYHRHLGQCAAMVDRALAAGV
jgi:adenylosuccinate lyase